MVCGISLAYCGLDSRYLVELDIEDVSTDTLIGSHYCFDAHTWPKCCYHGVVRFHQMMETLWRFKLEWMRRQFECGSLPALRKVNFLHSVKEPSLIESFPPKIIFNASDIPRVPQVPQLRGATDCVQTHLIIAGDAIAQTLARHVRKYGWNNLLSWTTALHEGHLRQFETEFKLHPWDPNSVDGNQTPFVESEDIWSGG